MSYFILKYRKYKQRFKKWWKAPLTPQFERLSQLVAIIGVVIASYYAIITYHLTIELGKNRDQVNLLDSIVITQKSQIDTLVRILNEMKIQNLYSEIQNKQLQIQTAGVIGQTNILSSQLRIIDTQNKQAINLAQLDMRASYNRFKNTFGEIASLLPRGGKKALYEYDNDQAAEFLNRIQPLLEKELENKYILSHDSLNRQWTSMRFATGTNIRIIQMQLGAYGFNSGYVRLYNNFLFMVMKQYVPQPYVGRFFFQIAGDSLEYN